MVADNTGWHIPQAAVASQDHTIRAKLHTPITTDILPPTTAIVDYASVSKNCQLTNSFSMILKWQ